MEVLKLKIVDNLLLSNQQDERIELINGEIVKCLIVRPDYALMQAGGGAVFIIVAQG